MNAAESRTTSADATSFLWKTFAWMAVGLGITGLVAYFIGMSPTAVQYIAMNRGIVIGLMVAQVGLVLAFSFLAHKVNEATAAAMFLGYAFMVGLTFSTLFLAYTAASISQMFLITAGAYGGLAFVGATTKRDLGPVGHFATMGLWGVIIASVVGFFWHSSALQFMISCAGVVVFAGLTAFDTQKLKRMYMERGAAGNLALRGALTLYLDFINLVLFMLRLFGTRRD
ncbi:MAG: Bax inhibitor-1/YccA family protein [Clostridia bacterium]|nr:Bax inhibitor-1/YccA family protein [Deltaproteobacteria bacterium]